MRVSLCRAFRDAGDHLWSDSWQGRKGGCGPCESRCGSVEGERQGGEVEDVCVALATAAAGPMSFWVAAFVSGCGCHELLARVLPSAI